MAEKRAALLHTGFCEPGLYRLAVWEEEWFRNPTVLCDWLSTWSLLTASSFSTSVSYLWNGNNTYQPTQLGRCEKSFNPSSWAILSHCSVSSGRQFVFSWSSITHFNIKLGWEICFLAHDEYKPLSVLEKAVPQLFCSESPSYDKILLKRALKKNSSICIRQRKEMQDHEGQKS